MTAGFSKDPVFTGALLLGQISSFWCFSDETPYAQDKRLISQNMRLREG
jgi:hypothetical protein